MSQKQYYHSNSYASSSTATKSTSKSPSLSSISQSSRQIMNDFLFSKIQTDKKTILSHFCIFLNDSTSSEAQCHSNGMKPKSSKMRNRERKENQRKRRTRSRRRSSRAPCTEESSIDEPDSYAPPPILTYVEF